jgi:hypothetical protein
MPAIFEMVGDWRQFLSQEIAKSRFGSFDLTSARGGLWEVKSFLDHVEKSTGRILRRMRPGRKAKRGGK